MTNTFIARLQKYIKLLVAIVLRYMGVFRLEGHYFCRRAFILAFHRVVRERDITQLLDPQMYVTVPVLRDLLIYLRGHYDLVTLKSLRERVQARENRKRPLSVLTFDDGYMDSYTNAFPILKEMGMPATFFLTAGLMNGTELLWYDAVSAACPHLLRSDSTDNYLGQLLSESGLSLSRPSTSGRDPYYRFARDLVEQLKRRPHAEIRSFLSRLQLAAPLDSEFARKSRLLTWDQVREMNSHGMDFGAHTVSHCILPVEDDAAIRREVQLSKAIIESELGTPVDAMAYPNGAYNDRVVRIAREAGFNSGLTLHKEPVSTRSDPMRLGRFLLNYQDITLPSGRFSPSLFEYESSIMILRIKNLFVGNHHTALLAPDGQGECVRSRLQAHVTHNRPMAYRKGQLTNEKHFSRIGER